MLGGPLADVPLLDRGGDQLREEIGRAGECRRPECGKIGGVGPVPNLEWLGSASILTPGFWRVLAVA